MPSGEIVMRAAGCSNRYAKKARRAMAAVLDMIQIGTPVWITMSFWKAINAAHGSVSATIVAA